MNLNTATNEQLDQYRDSIAKVQGIDPLMLDYIWMDDPETGLRNRVLYAKRGVAEILRHKLGISVTSLVSSENGGLITFTATGVDKTGRQEMAVGSAYLEGLRPEKKAHGIMTAQTKAVRRLTLQFITGGILDETEVQAQSALQGAPAAFEATLVGSSAVLPPPTVVPSALPGKIVEMTVIDHDKGTAKHEPARCLDCKALLSDHALVNSVLTCPPKADIQAATFDAGGPPNVHSVAQNPPNQGVTLQEISAKQPDIKADTEVPRTKRQYRRKNQVNIASPGQVPAEQSVSTTAEKPQTTEQEIRQGVVNPMQTPESRKAMEKAFSASPAELAITAVVQAKTEYHVPLPPHVGNNVVIIPDPSLQGVPVQVSVAAPTQVGNVLVPVLSKEKQDEYRTRLSKYYNDILPRGGMQSSENIGGPTMKTRKFAAIHTGVADTKQMTEQHWEDLFEFLDANAGNPKFLVDYINRALDVA